VSLPRSAQLLIIFVLALTATTATGIAQGSDWTTYRNDRFGFSLRYPVDVFATERTSEARDGEAFVGLEGGARLLVGAFVNDGQHTVESYRRFVAKESYSGFDISYAPLRETWFVLSGEGKGKIFYEKVMFSCGGRVINSFVLVYPVQSERAFDPIVEGIEKTFRPGRDCERYASR
jgi:hypothetical protein